MSAHNDDIDAEFQSLVASLGSTPAAGDSLPSLDPDDTPVDESLHLEGGRLSVALVLAPISYPEALHSLLALTGVRESIVRQASDAGRSAACRVPPRRSASSPHAATQRSTA